MNTTRNPVSAKRFAARTVLAAGLGLAVMGLAVGTANAAPVSPIVPGLPGPGAPVPTNPVPPPILRAPVNGVPQVPLIAPSITGPQRVVQGQSFTATLANFPAGSITLFVDSPSGQLIGQAANGTQPHEWPWNSPAGGYHQLYAQDTVGSQTFSAQTRVWIDFAPQ
jgi:hypothetical protein